MNTTQSEPAWNALVDVWRTVVFACWARGFQLKRRVGAGPLVAKEPLIKSAEGCWTMGEV